MVKPTPNALSVNMQLVGIILNWLIVLMNTMDPIVIFSFNFMARKVAKTLLFGDPCTRNSSINLNKRVSYHFQLRNVASIYRKNFNWSQEVSSLEKKSIECTYL